MNEALTNLRTQADAQLKSVIRRIYIDAINYLVSVTPNLTTNPQWISSKDNSGWPTSLDSNRHGDPLPIGPLLNYIDTPLDIFVSNFGSIYIKFPTVLLDGERISPYTIRRWRRESRYLNLSYMTEWESNIIRSGRLPTLEEFNSVNMTEPHVETSYNGVWINSDDSEAVILDKLQERYKKYKAVVKRKANHTANCKKLAHKKYITLRGNAMLALFKATKV